MPDQIRETAGTVLEATKGTGTPGRYRILAITEGKGSSGMYPRATLQEAAQNRTIAAGTHIFADHPSATDEMDRPERSIRDLAGVLTTDAQWSDEHNGLVAEARFFAPYQPLVADMAEAIGMSIRGDGEIEMREGQRTVTHLAHVHSVDLVTRAGRGGKVLELLESARNLTEARNVGQHFESRLHQDFTNRADDMAANGHLSRDERIHLSNAVGKGLSAFAGHLEEHAPQLYQRDIYDEPAQKPDVSESTTDTPKEGLVPELTEAEVTALRDSASKAEAERDRALAEAAAAKQRAAVIEARDTARPGVAAKVGESKTLGARTQARVVESVLRDLPVGDDGKVDEAKLTAAIEAAVKAAEDELAEYAPRVTEAFGAFGSQQAGGKAGISEADYDKASAATFGREIKGN